MGVGHATSHDVGMRQVRSALPWITTGAGLIVLLSGTSAAFGWALVVFGAALIAEQGFGGTRPRPHKRVAGADEPRMHLDTHSC